MLRTLLHRRTVSATVRAPASVAALSSEAAASTAPAPGQEEFWYDDQAHREHLAAFVARIGLQFDDLDVLQQVFTQKSFRHGREASHERLEFLGDKVLGYRVAQTLYAKHPNLPPQALSDALAVHVNNRSLSLLARKFGIETLIRWHPPPHAVGEQHSKLLADTIEALIGALHECQGLDAANAFIDQHILSRELNMSAVIKVQKAKATLLEHLSSEGKPAPEYQLISETGRLTHSSMFVVAVVSGSQNLGKGSGRSIRDAQQAAALDALQQHFGYSAQDVTL